MAVMWLFTAFCTFSNARTSIWRTRSRETPNSSASSSSVIGSSARRRADQPITLEELADELSISRERIH